MNHTDELTLSLCRVYTGPSGDVAGLIELALFLPVAIVLGLDGTCVGREKIDGCDIRKPEGGAL